MSAHDHGTAGECEAYDEGFHDGFWEGFTDGGVFFGLVGLALRALL